MYVHSFASAIWNCGERQYATPRGRPQRSRHQGPHHNEPWFVRPCGRYAAATRAGRLVRRRERSGWAVWILLAFVVAVWTAFRTITNAALDLHDDNLQLNPCCYGPGTISTRRWAR